MPFPLIPVVIGVVVLGVAGGGVAFVLPRLSKKLENQRVAILGRQRVGKTTLLRLLRDGHVPEVTTSTVDASLGGRFKLEVHGRSVEFDVPRDLPGNDIDLGFKQWKDAFCGADYVWYVFRADLLTQGDASTLEVVKHHFDRFKDWLDADPSVQPKIILIGTHADKDPRRAEDPAQFANEVHAASSIQLGMVMLNNAELVVGSLLTDRDARRLVKSLGGHL